MDAWFFAVSEYIVLNCTTERLVISCIRTEFIYLGINGMVPLPSQKPHIIVTHSDATSYLSHSGHRKKERFTAWKTKTKSSDSSFTTFLVMLSSPSKVVYFTDMM